MFFRFQQTANLLQVDDAYARLLDVTAENDLVFEFTYSVNPSQALNHNAHVVDVNVISRFVLPRSVLGATQRGSVDTRTMVDNIRLLILNNKTVTLQRDAYVLATKRSNIISFVNNEILQMVRAQVPAKDIPQLNSPKLRVVNAVDTKQDNNVQPLLHRVANSAAVPDIQSVLTGSALVDPRKLMQDMITRQGLDPSYVLSLTPRAQSELATRGGLSNTSTAYELSTDPASQLLNYHLFPPTSNVPPKTTLDLIDADVVQVIDNVTEATVEIPVIIVIKQSQLRLENADLTNVFVQFDLVETQSGEPVDTVIKALNISKELQVYNTPKLPPVVKSAVSPASTHSIVQIKQVDPGATSVQVYKKTLFASSTDLDEYALIGSYPLTSKQEALQIQVDVPLSSATVYRAIPIGAQGAQGFEFSSAVVKPSRYTPLRAVALSGLQVDQGIQLEARSIPVKCVAIQFLKWNLTTHDSSYTTVNSDVGFVDDAARAADLVVTIDSDVFDNNIYRYVARLIYEDGTVEDFGDVTLEFIKSVPGQVVTTLTDVVVNHDTAPDVTFNINTVTTDTDMDAIKRMLSNQDLQQFFQGDVQAQRDQLANLIAHSVQRVDLTTGVRESFGTVTVQNFTDSALRKSQAVSPLQYGHRYRYEIYPLLRAPETLFEAFVKQATDSTTKKPYVYNPAKFRHPLALTRGVLVSQAGAGQRYAKDPMSFGVVGAIATIEVSFDDDTAKVTNQSATRFNRTLNIITWQVQGDVNQIDHFLIMKQVNGIRTAIGKAHAEFPFGACQYFHPVTHHDNGGISYVITPVMIDYKVGPTATTNTLIVDAP